MIVFDKIEIEGFGSIIEPLSYVLNRPGINLIFGKNGSGKTRIISAISWALYGKTLNGKVEPWPHLLDRSFNGTKVKIDITTDSANISIIRCRKYKGKIEGSRGASKLFLYINGEYQKEFRDINPTQVKIIEILGMSFDLFKNSILFGQKLTRLLSEKGDKQKAVFEEAFDMPYIARGKDKAKAELDILRSEFRDIDTEYQLLKSNYNHTKELLDIAKTQKANFKSEKKSKIESIELDIEKQNNHIEALKQEKIEYLKLKKLEDELKTNYKAVTKKIKKLENIDKEHFSIDLELAAKKGELKHIKSQVETFKRNLSSKTNRCFHCGQPLNAKQVKKQKDEWKLGIDTGKKEISNIKLDINRLSTRLNKLSSSISKLKKYREELSSIEISLDNLEELGFGNCMYRPKLLKAEKIKIQNLKQLYDDTKSKTYDSSEFKRLTKKLKDEKNKLSSMKADYKLLKRKVELHEWVIKDPLSNKGLKNYIFNEELNSVNKQLKKYGKFLGYTIKLVINLESSNKDFSALIYKGDNITPYEDLSGGQAQLVDVCLAFAIHDAIFYTREINLLIMDEVFESLDDSNIDVVAELIRIKASNLPIHIITHRKEFLSSKINNMITLQLNSSGVTEVL